MKLMPAFFQRKSKEISNLIFRYYATAATWTPPTFRSLAKEGYQKNVWVYRAIKYKAETASRVPWLLYRRKRNGELEEVTDHELLKLINKPNHMQSGQEFREAYFSFELLAGNAYALKVGPKVGAPRELWSLRPDRVVINPDRYEYVKSYTYTIDQTKGVEYDRKQVIHSKNFAPLDDYYGLSAIQVAARGIDNDNAANEWNTGLLQNGARPSGAMMTEGELTDPQYKRLQKEIDRKYKGAKNAGRPMLLEGGLKWQEMSLSPKDMDFIKSKQITQKEICAAIGVAPELLGDSDNKTYSNYKEARFALYQEGVLPILDRFRDKMNAELVPAFGEDLYLTYDKDSIDALKENADALWERVMKAIDRGLLEINEGREAIGYEAVEGGNVRYIKAGLLPVGADAEYDGPEPGGDGDPKHKGGSLIIPKSLNIQGDRGRVAYFKAFDRNREGFYNPAAAQIKKHFRKEKKEVIKEFKERGTTAAIIDGVAKNEKNLKRTLKALYQVVIEEFGTVVFDNLVKNSKNQGIKINRKEPEEPGFNIYAAEVQDFIDALVAQKVVMITDTTVQLLKQDVYEGINRGESIDEIAARIDRRYLDQIIPNRSVVIARTEVIGASNYGSRAAAKQTGLNLKKEWLATHDKRTRDTHSIADGQTREMDEPYEIGGSRLMFPGDPSGAAKEVIQCRCTEIYHTIE
jgi:HK97 family phage portal protein